MSTVSTSSSRLWSQVLANFRTMFPGDIFSMWFEPLKVAAATDKEVILDAPNDFVAIWIQDNYLELIQREVAGILGHPVPVKIVVQRAEDSSTGTADSTTETGFPPHPEPTPERPTFTPPSSRPGNRDSSGPATSADRRPISGLNPKNTFDNFIVGTNNQLAHAASIAVSNTPGRAYNPLFIYGDTGLGKTHLMHSIAHQVLQTNPGSVVAYVSTEKFTNKFIRSIQEASLPKFRRFYRRVDILLIDDIQFLANKERIQEEFFHTFNELFENGKQIVLTSDRPAGEIAKLESRLLSRFQWGLVADIQAPDVETRMAILSKKARNMGIDLNEEILEFLAEKVTRNVRRMEGALTRIAGYTSLIRDPLTIDAVAKLLHDILQEEMQHQVTVDKIQAKTADYFKLNVADLSSRRKPVRIVVPRQIAMYLSRVLTSNSLMQIGEAFGGRDHGTVIHAIKQVEALMEQDDSVRSSVDYLMKQLSQSS